MVAEKKKIVPEMRQSFWTRPVTLLLSQQAGPTLAVPHKGRSKAHATQPVVFWHIPTISHFFLSYFFFIVDIVAFPVAVCIHSNRHVRHIYES